MTFISVDRSGTVHFHSSMLIIPLYVGVETVREATRKFARSLGCTVIVREKRA